MLNKIIDAYIDSDIPLTQIIENVGSKPYDPILRAILYIEECLSRKRLARDAFAAAHSVSIKGSDPNLLIIMLSRWSELSCSIIGFDEAKALIHKAKALVSPETNPTIQACLFSAESILSDSTGDKTKREKILRNILKLLPFNSPRRKFYVRDLSSFLARQGRGTELRDEFNKLTKMTNQYFPESKLELTQFVNAVETCNTTEALRILSLINHNADAPHTLSDNTYRVYYTLLRQMLYKKTDIPFSTPVIPPTWIKVLKCLKNRDTDEAIRIARLEASKVLSSILGSGFESFNLIRAELADGNMEAARRLIEMRHTRGNSHYLDNFFMTRVHLLENDRKSAAECFDNVLISSDYYGARGRLDFELTLSCEVSYCDIIDLVASTKKTKAKKRNRSKVTNKPLVNPIKQPKLGIKQIIGKTSSIAKVKQSITQFADTSTPVMITGETGTGKELVARALHESSSRKDKPFVPVNCSAIAETLLESELFGHKRGAFTGAETENVGLFEEAGEGTIFLDEIGEIMPRLQRALLRVLETGEIRAVGSTRSRKIKCRILAATNADVNTLAEKGLFRHDLIFRLQRLGIHIPPLRSRKADIILLTHHFLDVGRRSHLHASISTDMEKTLLDYEWPGNVRELKNIIERMRLMHSDKLSYSLPDLDLKFHTANINPTSDPGTKKDINGKQVSQNETAILANTQINTQPNQSENFLQHGKSSVRRLDQLRNIFTIHKKATRSEIIQTLNISPNTATKYLKILIDEGFIKRVEPSQSTRSHYFTIT